MISGWVPKVQAKGMRVVWPRVLRSAPGRLDPASLSLDLGQVRQKEFSMGPPGMVLSAIAAVVGAMMHWAITYQGTGFRLSTIGAILLIAGAVGFAVSAIILATSRRQVGSAPHSMDRQVTDASGHTTSLHEERKYPSRIRVEWGPSTVPNSPRHRPRLRLSPRGRTVFNRQ